MKKNFFIVFVCIGSLVNAQQIDYNLKKGFASGGYDVVEYFNNNAVEGDKKYTSTYDSVKYKFISQANLDVFIAAPESYIPQYGGYCAYAVAQKRKKVDVDPETFEIRDGKLYLFYNSWGVNTLEKWNEEGPEALKKQADIEWQTVKDKN
jgi:YHS domain-containing protein